ncbi:MAG: HAD family hydrolase [Firmicutes bacterium]|nr:HAD family hydrolase [Bacillota bacterium]
MEKNWHSRSNEELFNELNTTKSGLSNQEVEERLKKYGKNVLPKKKTDSFFKIFIKQLLDPIVILLIITVIFSLIINEIIDACAIIFIILVDLLLGTFQEWKAEKNAESLANLIKVKCKVIRENKEIEIDSSELVIGDILLLESGNKISADARILECHNLQVDESVLTGESISIVKNSSILPDASLLAERKNMVYAGTSVTTGRAECLITSTGIETEIGHIASHVSNAKETKSPLTIRMEKFSKQISLLVVVVAIIIAVLLMYKNVPGSEIFLSVIALSVSAMPEGLPLALTMALTIASNRMSKKNVIVKKLNSVESLGSCTVIASDKTGTLTVNEQTAKKIVLASGETFEVEGTGYNDKGNVIPSQNTSLEKAYEIGKLTVLNNEASLIKKDDNFEYFGDSIDIAFLALGQKLKVNTSDIKIINKIPYESENKYSAVFYEENNSLRCTIKGSIEKVIEFSKTMKEEKITIDIPLLEKQNEDLAKEGYRVIAIADGEIENKNKDEYTTEDIKNLNFLGMVAFIDPVREEVKDSIQKCETAGIKVIMITGDHPLTAFSIAKELGLAKEFEEVTTGLEVNEYLKKGQIEFDEFIKNKKVFTRVTPIDKLEIVESLRRQGEFVAVTGDGVNDAPAIKSANIGIAMGSGTDVAKETASMIIIDDNFQSIVSGIEEGRCAYSNIRKVSYMLLSCGLAEVFFFILSIIFDLPLPLVAIQLLWLNIVTDGLQDFALSFEKIEPNTMKQKPRSTKESIFNKELLSEVALAGFTIGILVFAVWVYLIDYLKMDVGLARGYIMALMVFMQNIHVLNCRSERESTFRISLKSNWLIPIVIVCSLILQVIVMEVGFLSTFLQTSTIPVIDLVILFLISTIILVVMEIYKEIKYKNHKKQKI